MADRESLEFIAKVKGISLTPETLSKVLERELEEYECPECGRDCGDLTRHAFDDVNVIWYFTCEHCGIDFGGDL